MGMLNKPTTNSDHLAKNIKPLDSPRKAYDESYKSFLAGRSIEVAQSQAQKKIDGAQEAADKLILNAESILKDAEAKLAKAVEAQRVADSTEMTARNLIDENKALKSQLDAEMERLKQCEARSMDAKTLASKVESEYKQKLSETKRLIENIWEL